MSRHETHIVITGLMGSGKTIVGLAVARGLGLPFSDSDAAIAATTGRTGRQIADTDGVQALHDLEARHLLNALAGVPGVVAAAASVLDNCRCERSLASVKVAFLDVAPPVLAVRLAPKSHRRRLEDPPKAHITGLFLP